MEKTFMYLEKAKSQETNLYRVGYRQVVHRAIE